VSLTDSLWPIWDPAGIEIGDVRTLIVAGDLEGATRSCRSFLEDQHDLLAFQMLLLGAGIFGALEIASQIEEIVEFPLREVLHRQQ
jgi:hypothetical protein